MTCAFGIAFTTPKSKPARLLPGSNRASAGWRRIRRLPRSAISGGKILPRLPHGLLAQLGEHQLQPGSIDLACGITLHTAHDAPAMPGRSP